MPFHRHLPRLSNIWTTLPVYFITVCTHDRRPILTNPVCAQILIDEWTKSVDRHGWMIGRYVIMPDHVHFFSTFVSSVLYSHPKSLSEFMQQWKQWTSRRILAVLKNNTPAYLPPIWQKSFFDHLIRSEESYSQKWEYVRENPIRKGLVKNTDDWQWQGEIFDLS